MVTKVYNGNTTPNPNYQVTLTRDLPTPIKIVGNLPETFGLGVQADYEKKLPSSLDEVLGNSRAAQIYNTANAFTKFNRIFRPFTHQVWNGTSPLEFTFPMLFDAYNDAQKDVVDPIKILMQMTLPYNDSSASQAGAAAGMIMKPPGPTLANPNEGRISLKVGNFFYVHSVLLIDVNTTFHSRFTKDGQPIAADCDVTVRTVNTPSQEDLEKFFISKSSSLYTDYGVIDSQVGQDAAAAAVDFFKKAYNPTGDI